MTDRASLSGPKGGVIAVGLQGQRYITARMVRLQALAGLSDNRFNISTAALLSLLRSLQPLTYSSLRTTLFTFR
jgi:hypothetical protein